MKFFVLFRYGVIDYSQNFGQIGGFIPIAIIPAEDFESAKNNVNIMFPDVKIESINFCPQDICDTWFLAEVPLVKSVEQKNLINSEDE